MPFLTLSDVDQAVDELEWCLEHGARVVSIRNGPAFTPEGTKSPADPMFDPFWARVGRGGRGRGTARRVRGRLRRGHAADRRGVGPVPQPATGDAVDRYSTVISMLMKHRLVHDFAGILVADKLFERHPGVRVAYIENGGTWVGDLLHELQVLHGQNPGMFAKNPVDQFHEHCWVAPFVEDSVPELAEHLPVERILFGSDWPHAEGMGHPRDFFKNVEEFSLEDQRRIMRENARELTHSTTERGPSKRAAAQPHRMRPLQLDVRGGEPGLAELVSTIRASPARWRRGCFRRSCEPMSWPADYLHWVNSSSCSGISPGARSGTASG